MNNLKRAAVTAAVFGLSVAAPRIASAYSYTCQLSEVDYWNIAGEERIVAACAVPRSDGITYFAVSTSNSGLASRFLAMMTSALIGQREVSFTWDPALTPNVSGCQTSDCRTPRQWALR